MMAHRMSCGSMPLVLLAVLLGAAACGEAVESGAPAKPKAKVVKKAEETAEPAPATADYFYNPAGKRDPFQGFASRQGSLNALGIEAPPLQRYDVEKFTLTGVISAVDIPRALLVDPEGIGHVVRVGTYVGRNWGKVTSISEDGVVVTEEYQTLDGELVVNPVTLRFPGNQKK
jgi:type IV pilus assembly protein PilP